MFVMLRLSMKAIVEIIQTNITGNVLCKIEDIWLDVGANIHGETIVVTDMDREVGDVLRSYQILSPRQLSNIKAGIFTLEDVERLVDDIDRRKN